MHALHADDPALLVRRLLTSGAHRAAAQVTRACLQPPAFVHRLPTASNTLATESGFQMTNML